MKHAVPRPDIRATLRASFADSNVPVPINVRGIVDALGAASDVLVRRGWTFECVDANGIWFLWPPSRVPQALYYSDMESPLTILLVQRSLTIGYILAGMPTLRSYDTLAMEDVVTETETLAAVELHRWPMSMRDPC